MTSLAARQFEAFKGRFAGVSARDLPNGNVLVTVPGVRLAEGWNRREATVRFNVPIGFPFSPPDCFWADADLRTAAGAQPQNSAPQTLPLTGEPVTWFSWHLQTWDPNRDSLMTFFHLIEQRLSTPR